MTFSHGWGEAKAINLQVIFLSWEAALREHWDDTRSKCESHTLTEHFLNAVSLALRSNPLGPHYNPVCVCPQLLSHVQPFATPWMAARQAPLSMGFSRQDHCSGLPFPPAGDRTHVSYTGRQLLYPWATWEAPLRAHLKPNPIWQPSQGVAGTAALGPWHVPWHLHTPVWPWEGGCALVWPVTTIHPSALSLLTQWPLKACEFVDTWAVKNKSKNSCTQFCLDWVHTFQGKWTPLSCWLWP